MSTNEVRERVIESGHFVRQLAANVENDKLSDSEFRELVRNTLPIVLYVDCFNKRTAFEWCEHENVSIRDFDGWPSNEEYLEFFQKRVHLEEFQRRLVQCTQKDGYDQEMFEGLWSRYKASMKHSQAST